MFPLFKLDETVIHLSKGKTGKVIGFIGGEECRYYVNHSGFTWSVPQKDLDSKMPFSRVNDYKELE
jgi:NADPH-dependent curcumin reductase CurA